MNFIKGKVSLYKALWLKWRSLRDIPFRKKFFVGYDLNGNTYWEFYLENRSQRMRRIVEYRTPGPHYENSASSKDIAPQCMMWLRRTRADFPSLEELAGDLQRQARIKILAQQADERWKSGSKLLHQGLTEEQKKKLDGITGHLHQDTQNSAVSKTFDPESPVESASIAPRKR